MLNCPYSCTYCYLLSYLEHRRIVVFTNTEKLKKNIEETLSDNPPLRLTTGELGDSLALDHLTETTSELLPLFGGTETLFELRTKSTRVEHLLESILNASTRPGEHGSSTPRKEAEKCGVSPMKDNLVITWTLGPDRAIRNEEPGTPTFDERLEAMSLVSGAGIKVGIRFDPIIPFYADLAQYKRLVEGIAEAVDAKSIHRFELGCLRFPAGLWDHIRKNNPRSALLRGEYIKDREGKMRLYRPKRVKLYRDIYRSILSRFRDVPVELSMESRTVWEDVGLEPPSGT
ncbi:MAG: hypothetical protein KAX38_01765, partial [Candidatus Krumholzibacteria bacterium]|nr:hypothetical protein [Candidatus Krumholzibacteria bacterium]